MKSSLCIYVMIAFLLQLAASRRNKKSHRIIAGRPADIEEFPYQVSLERLGEHFCGGSILHARLILTAAHCTTHLRQLNDVSPNSMMVRVGTSVSGYGGVQHAVKQVIPHESYDDRAETDSSDIALILLEDPIQFNDRAQPVKFPKVPPKLGEKGWVTGFGSQLESATRNLMDKRQLMAVEIPVRDTNECKKSLKKLGGIVADDMFCAGYKTGHKDACRGDSGGPFQANGILYGAVAWGIGCGRDGLPGVYTDLHQYKDWIKATSAAMLHGVAFPPSQKIP